MEIEIRLVNAGHQDLLLFRALERLAFSKMMFQPFNFTRILASLGYDPYPLAKGKSCLFGSNAHFQPNMFLYLTNIYKSHGLSVVYNGIVASITHCLTFELSRFYIHRFMNVHFPELGGKLDNQLIVNNARGNRHHLTVHQLFRFRMRHMIRETISVCIALTVASPFWVVMVRQVAQFVGNETKYGSTNILQPLRLIVAEEGWAGLWAGLIPGLVGQLFFNSCATVLSIVAGLGINYLQNTMMNDRRQQVQPIFVLLRFNAGRLSNYIAGALHYPFLLVSTVMAVNGSSLAIAMPPFMPPQQFNHWSDVFNHFWFFQLYRGRSIFLRRERGPLSIGIDGKLYASNKRNIFNI